MVNPNKCAKKHRCYFSLRRYHLFAQLIFNNLNILLNSSVITSTWLWINGYHISSKLQQAYQCLSMLYSFLNQKSSIQKKCFFLTYKQILRLLLTYACPIWDKCATFHISKIQVFQNKMLRIITNAPWFRRNVNLHNDLQIQEMVDYIKTLSKNFYSWLLNSSGSLHYN